MKKEKLLLMGVSSDSRYVLEYAKKLGVTTVVTDNRPLEISVEKRIADEYWMIDLKDLDALEKKCQEEKITGIYAGNNEFCLDQTKELCQRLGLFFYASQEGWLCARDKKVFKQRCMECGISVPREYAMSDFEMPGKLYDINYPLVVKPVDSCAQQGFSLCWNEKELMQGLKKAKDFSKKGQVLTEEYIEGDEIAAHYFLVDGKAFLIDVEDIHMMKMNGVQKGIYVENRSCFYKEFVEKESEKIQKFFEKSQCRWGNIFLQIIRRAGTYYFLEMGYRIDGVGLWNLYKELYGFSSVELMVDLALGRDINNSAEKIKGIDFMPSKVGGIYLPWARQGRIMKIEGRESVECTSGMRILWERFKEGDYIYETGNMYQMAFGISVIARDQEEMKERIDFINKTLHIFDDKEQELLIYYQEYMNHVRDKKSMEI